MRYRNFLCLGILLSTLGAVAQTSTPPIALEVDASTISKKLLNVHESFPIAATSNQSLDLVYPKWIPGNHAPTGPIADLVSLRFTAGGKQLDWARDPVDMYRFRVSIPPGTNAVVADFSLVGTYQPGNDFGPGNTSTPVQGDVNWDQLVLYPANTSSDQVTISAAIKLPEHWSYATALPHPSVQREWVRFDPVSLTTLVDSPLMCGSIMREFDITPPGIAQKHYIDLFAESAEGLEVSADRVAAFRNLIAEERAMFRSHHYASYRFLVEAQTESSDGLEHHESSDDQVPANGMISAAFAAEGGNLLAHEMIHSWNGKFRRPAGLATPDYQQPMVGDLLWVYEGLTSYWAEILAGRAGLETTDQVKDRLALDYAEMATRSGRSWRNLQDTARAAQMLYTAGQQWTLVRRSTDYYIEGPLLWLQVDSVLREKSHGTRSLDDFAADFFKAPDGAVTVKPYTYEDLLAALKQQADYDWDGLLKGNLNALRPAPVSPGLEASGWTVSYTDEPNGAMVDTESATQQIDFSTSLGLILDQDGTIIDVAPDSAAGRAGLAPATKVMAVDQRVYSADLLRQAITHAESTQQLIHLLTLTGGYYNDVPLDYHGGLHFPHLTRVAQKTDWLTRILEPRRSK